MYLEFALYNLWHHHFQYNTSYFLGLTYILKLLHMYLNSEHKMNRSINISIKLENEKISWQNVIRFIYISFQIKCVSFKTLECNIETNIHYLQFIWLVSPISFPFNVQIGCIFFGFKSQVELYSFDNLKINFLANIPNACIVYIFL